MLRSSLISAGVALVLFVTISYVPAGAQAHNQPEYARSAHAYRTPAVSLIDAREHTVDFAAAVAQEEMVIISLAFTSCTGTCPVITANLVQALPELKRIGNRYRIFLVSLDPEHDTPARLREYQARFNTGEKITLLTGSRTAIHDLLRAYNAIYPGGNKMNHQPLTLIRAGKNAPWIRLEGLVSGSDLAREVRLAIEQAGAISTIY
ncbi:protein SCO1/2 [Nitrosomonas sp. Nm51]|uniref:SCO family protein n=1 Tax=Nitrosomonas sp. Nm51 TaxID=133720 RepID=UPI0008B27DE6|nr:SCO family protein [Nitrosomonas sp. Nm51]SER52264.1 protein SCO1/2 [Nitrosomonas sp. Nm51]